MPDFSGSFFKALVMYNSDYIATTSEYSPMSPEIVNCLVNEMKIFWGHFEKKYSSFSSEVQSLIDSKLLQMLDISRSIKAGNIPSEEFNTLYNEGGDEPTNEFLWALFDCFKQWQLYEGIELQKNIYKHTNRGTDNWFPIVKIEEQINECSVLEDNFVVYRGCNHDEFETNTFRQRQSWTRDFKVAKTFAYYHPPSTSSLKQRVIIKAVIDRKDVLWDRVIESEMVLRLGFVPVSASIIFTYEDFLKQQ